MPPSDKQIAEQVDIYAYPARRDPDGAKRLIIGDLHANPIKALYFLIREGIVDLQGTQEEKELLYKKLVIIYEQWPDGVTQEQVDFFAATIANLQVVNPDFTIDFAGDEFADRGLCDYYMLLIFAKLSAENIHFNAIFSNHGAEFIKSYEAVHLLRKNVPLITSDLRFALEHREKHFRSLFDSGTFTTGMSITGLQNFIDRGVVSEDKVLELIDAHYKPNVKLLNYSLSEDGKEITLIAHSYLGIDTIELLANRFNIPFKDDTTLELAQTIDEINKVFNDFVMRNSVHQLTSFLHFGKIPADMKMDPIHALAWGRESQVAFRPLTHKGYKCKFVHGHDTPSTVEPKHVVNLENNLARTSIVGLCLTNYLNQMNLPVNHATMQFIYDKIKNTPGLLPSAEIYKPMEGEYTITRSFEVDRLAVSALNTQTEIEWDFSDVSITKTPSVDGDAENNSAAAEIIWDFSDELKPNKR